MDQSRRRILIVDDAPENIQMLMGALRDEYSILAATSGEKALEVARKEPPPDLILLDVTMPGMDGYAVMEKLSRIDSTMKIPVMFVTARSEAGDEARGLELGAVDYITKPFNPDLVKARIRNQMELKRYRDDLEETVAFRTRELLETTAAKEKLESELRVARSLQMAMIPPGRAVGEEGRYEIAAVVKPAKAVGGDLFDYFLLPDGRLCFFVGDVSDKGVPAALFMVKASTLMRTEAVLFDSPGEILGRVNHDLCRDNDECMFVTMVVGILDLESGRLSLASAGHEFPFKVAPGRSTELLLLSGGPALGLDMSARFEDQEAPLAPGDGVVFYTDGITEAFSGDGRPFGDHRLLESVSGHADAEPPALLTAVLDELSEFVGSAPPSDDITLFVLRYRGPGRGA
jgi:sigma-B regulation protein RsbU (phosphoserine phosphatase)